MSTIRGRKVKNMLRTLTPFFIAGFFFIQPAFSQADDIAVLKEKAGNGVASAQYALSLRYLNGRDVPKNVEEAIRWLKKAADGGDADAEYVLGGRYIAGNDVPLDEKRGKELLAKSAEQGHAGSLDALCHPIKAGKFQNPDAHWCLKAAEHGNIWAAPLLGKIYDEGIGVPRDAPQAFMWHSINPDDFEALDDLTKRMTPEEVLKGKQLLAAWRDKVAKGEVADARRGDRAGVLCLWTMFTELKASLQQCPSAPGPKQDLPEAYFWLSLAAADKSDSQVEAQRHSLGKRLTQEQRFAVDLRVKAWKPKVGMSAYGSTGGAGASGDDGGLAKQDGDQALNRYLLSAEQGDRSAQVALGNLYSSESDGGMSDEALIKELDSALDKIDNYIVANSPDPVTKSDLIKKANDYRLPYGCLGSQGAKQRANHFKGIPPEEFKSDIERALAVPGKPQMEPCL